MKLLFYRSKCLFFDNCVATGLGLAPRGLDRPRADVGHGVLMARGHEQAHGRGGVSDIYIPFTIGRKLQTYLAT